MALDPAPDQGEDWCMVDSDGQRYRLPKTMLFMGSEECDIVVRSQTVDKRHAVITFDHYLNKFKIKDLSTINGTFVNEYRIPDQEYVTLKHMDSVRLGYDSMVYRMEELPDEDTQDVLDNTMVSNGNKMPSWATKELPSMAECEGCIAEQHLSHTCSHDMNDELSEMDHINAAYRSYHETDDKKNNSSLGSNTWPRKRIRNTQNIASLFTTDNGTSFDDSDYGCSRILRGDSSGNPDNLPAELVTVKKATPLYGQPDWWGEDDNSQYTADNEQKLDRLLEQGKRKLDSSMYSSDIPQRDDAPERDKSTPPRELRSMSSSISKDSLQSHGTSILNSPDRDPSSRRDSDTGREKKSDGESNISMAFTVEFDDESPKMKMVGSLSEFMPSKIRKSFKDRKSKPATKSGPLKADIPKDETVHRDISPERLKKIDDLWKSLDTKPSHSSDSKHKSKSSIDKDEDKVDLVPVKGPKTHKRNSSLGGGVKSKISKSKETDTHNLHAGQSVSDNASYLIDKMFESGSDKDVKSGRTSKKISDRFTEHALYKEAKQYDSAKSLNVKKSSTENLHKDSHKKDVTKPSILKKGMNDSLNRETKKSGLAKAGEGKINGVDKDKKSKAAHSSKKKSQDQVEVSQPTKEEDNVSEAGTYTIDTEVSSKEEEEARKNIDRVFGLTPSTQDTYSLVQQEQVSRSREGETTLIDLEDEVDELEQMKSVPGKVTSLEAEAGSEACLEELRIVEDNENPSEVLPEDAPKWVTQWAALTNQKSKNFNMEVSSPSSVHSLSSDKDDARLAGSKKPPSGISRKRPGTGRKLPTLPTDKGSPEGSDHSSKLSESTSDSPRCPSTQYTENGYSNDSARQKAVKISSHVVSRYEDTDTETVSRTKFESDIDSMSKDGADSARTSKSSRSSRSVGSLDTEILLRDTETVMAAMEARMESKSHPKQNGHLELNGDIGSELDSESTIAIINGDEEYIKPTQFESPRDNLVKLRSKQSKTVNRTNSASARLQAFRERNYKRHSYGGERSVVSDIFSESEVSEVNIPQSDVSTEVADNETSFSRSGSKGKGNMTMTRPNRAFQLRRARADGEIPDTSRTSASTNVSGYSTPKTPSSVTTTSTTSSKTPKSKPRTIIASARTNDSARSEASLGAQIVQKSRDNKSSEQFDRTDGGRHSLRLMRSQSLSTKDSSQTDSSSHKTDLKAIKSRLKNASNYGLTVTSMNKSSSSSQPASRSNSPKSAEKAAWKRRKEYDPRKAVADAKAKAAKVKGASSAGKSKMTRSASFTNSLELRHYKDSYKSESVSSVDDVSSATSDHNGVFDDCGLRRGFLPYSGRSHSSRLYHSSEDEELSLVVKSSQDLSRCLLGSIPYLSAFTPPPPKVMSPTPDFPPMPLSVFKHSSYGSRPDNHLSVLKSYDNILVKSIYQLSHKLKNSTDRTLTKLRESRRIESDSPSPIDDILSETCSNSDIPAWKSANQDLAGILQNMRKIEHHMRLVNRVLFPDDDSGSETLGLSGQEKQEYLQEIERIRSELAGFQPISQPDESWKEKDELESVESDCEELGGGDEFF